MIWHVLSNLIAIAYSCAVVYAIFSLTKIGIEKLRMPKHSQCGSRWHVRRYAYYYDVPLYQCSKCEHGKSDYHSLSFFLSTEDDADRLKDHMLCDELELGHEVTIPDMWRHINYRPEVPSE